MRPARSAVLSAMRLYGRITDNLKAHTAGAVFGPQHHEAVVAAV
jgi:hypothetical protein